MFKNLRRQPVRQREQAGAQKRQNGDPGGLDLFGRNQRAALFLGLHLGEISPRPNEARPLGRVIRRTGLRLRYELHRKFAPYIGAYWQKLYGDTADMARDEGDQVEDTAVVAGLRVWF